MNALSGSESYGIRGRRRAGVESFFGGAESRRRLGLLYSLQVIALVAAIAAVFRGMGVSSQHEWALFAVLLSLAGAADLLPARISLTASTPIAVTCTMLIVVVAIITLGPAGAAVIGALALLPYWIFVLHYPWPHLLGNICNFMWSALITGWLFDYIVASFDLDPGVLGFYILVFASSIFILAVNFFIMAADIHFAQRIPMSAQVRESLAPLAPVHGIAAVMSGIVIYLYFEVGVTAMALAVLLVIVFNYLVGAVSTSRQRRTELEEQVVERTAELKQANADLATFSDTLAHDLRSPLSSIASLSSLVSNLDESPDNPQIVKESLGHIHDASRGMLEMLEGLYTLAHATRARVSPISCDPAELAHSTVESFREESSSRNLTIEVHPMPPCFADPCLLRVVYQNLIGNAIKYTEGRDPTTITVASHREGDRVVYSVSDDGSGVDDDLREELFTVGARTSRTDKAGLGIGLATVRRAIEGQGGEIWLEGANKGPGACFLFTLPQSPAEDEADAELNLGLPGEGPAAVPQHQPVAGAVS